MEDSEEFTANDQAQIAVKGRRTKRQRPLSPIGAAVISTSSGGGSDGDAYSTINPSPSDHETSADTEEDEDLANCLILLAQGGGGKQTEEEVKSEKFSSRRFSEVVTADGGGKGGFDVYECKTCNRAFPSFQALGGHRASHKKPRNSTEEKKSLRIFDGEEEGAVERKFGKVSTSLSMIAVANREISDGNNNKQQKIHECSICGSEFSSGQALGGHMRRHRAPVIKEPPPPQLLPSSRNMIALDLNLPAPEEDHREAKYQGLVFSASALVDCHY